MVLLPFLASSPTEAEAEARARSQEIENQLAAEALQAKKEIKMVMFESGDAGGSALLRRMEFIHHGGYDDRERKSYREVAFSNTIQAMKTILKFIPDLDLELSPETQNSSSVILSIPDQLTYDTLPHDVAEALRSLWHDQAIQEANRRSNEFDFGEAANYFLNSIERLLIPHYLPTDQDILYCRFRSGITEATFRVKELTYRIFHLSGQRGELIKWIHCFDNVKALLFVVNMAGYDEMLYEDDRVTCMQEALTRFNSICNSRWFSRTSIVLLLNHTDRFAEKLPHLPLVEYFPDYTGGNNYDAACDCILHRFVSLNQSAATKQIYAHFTSLNDDKQLKFVSSAVQDILLQDHLREILGKKWLR